MDRKNPLRCFDRRYFAWVTPGLVVLFALAFFGRRFERGTPARIAVAVLLGIVMGYIIVLTVESIRRLDELQQRIHLEAIAISFTITAVLITASAFLTKAGAHLPHWDVGWWPFMAFTWVAAALVRYQRYR